MFELFTEGITLLNAISLLAFITTVGLFLCGFPICRQICKRKGTKEISGAPFMMGVVGGSCWWTYGYLKNDLTLLYVTSTQVVLYSSYLLFYWYMTANKLKISLKCAAVIGICVSLYLLVHFFGMKVHHPLGVVCLCLNVADFAAPLGGIKYVIRKWSTQTLPLPLCIGNFMVSSEWFIYGFLVNDLYLILPNGIGAILATGQLVLFVALPRKTGFASPLSKLVKLLLCSPHKNEAIVEPDNMKKTSAALEIKSSKQAWRKKLIDAVVEFGNTLQECTGKDQFGYKSDLVIEGSDAISYATTTTLDKLDSNQSTVNDFSAVAPKMEMKGVFVPYIQRKENDSNNMSLCASQLIAKLEPELEAVICEPVVKSSNLKRSASSPVLRL